MLGWLRAFVRPSEMLLCCASVDGWMADLRILVIAIVIVIAIKTWAGDNEKLCATKSRFRLKRSPPRMRLEPGTAKSVGKRASV